MLTCAILPLLGIVGGWFAISRSHDAVIGVYDEAGNVIETHEHPGQFQGLIKFFKAVVSPDNKVLAEGMVKCSY